MHASISVNFLLEGRGKIAAMGEWRGKIQVPGAAPHPSPLPKGEGATGDSTWPLYFSSPLTHRACILPRL